MRHYDCKNYINLDCEKGLCALTKGMVPIDGEGSERLGNPSMKAKEWREKTVKEITLKNITNRYDTLLPSPKFLKTFKKWIIC